MTPNTSQGLQGVIANISHLIDLLIPLLVGATIIAFFWGLFLYVVSRDEKNGRPIMVTGLVALFIMVSVWGLVKLIQNTLGVSNNNSSNITLPTVPKPGNTSPYTTPSP